MAQTKFHPEQLNKPVMVNWRRVGYVTLLPMALVIPLWVGIGRGLFGVLSIGALYTAILAAPLLFVTQLAITQIVKRTPATRKSRTLPLGLGRALTTYYLAAFIFGFTFVDFSANGSALVAIIVGNDCCGSHYDLSDLSWWLSAVSALVAVLFLLISLAWAIRDLRAAKRHSM